MRVTRLSGGCSSKALGALPVAGDDKENRQFFDGFSMPGLVTAAYREAWGN